MGVYTCCECDNWRDSDDGCYECKEHKFGLICPSCKERMEINEEGEEVSSSFLTRTK